MFLKNIEDRRFDISSYNGRFRDYASEATYECGTSACFCGYGPLAGIRAIKNELWSDYADRAFAGRNEKLNWSNWNWLFSDSHKNSRMAACRRAAYFLMNGLPKPTAKWFKARYRYTPFKDELRNELEDDYVVNRYLSTAEVPHPFIPDWEAIRAAAN